MRMSELGSELPPTKLEKWMRQISQMNIRISIYDPFRNIVSCAFKPGIVHDSSFDTFA